MKKKSFPRILMYVTLCCTLIFALGLMAGCKGSDGSAGATGATGPAGPAGPVTATGESCMICHANGQIADMAPFHPDKLTKALEITNVVVSSSATGTPVVTFQVNSATLVSDGTFTGPRTGLAGIAATNFRPYIADLVPAGTVTSPTGTSVPNLTGTLATDYFETWAAERSTTAGWSLVDNGGGSYTWTATTLWGVPTAGAGLNAADVNVTVGTGHTQRLFLRLSNPSATTYAKGGAAFVDFKVPANGAAATPLDSQRVMVTIQACWKCHSTTLLAAGHGGGYVDTKGCVVCHSPLYATGTNPAGFMANYTQDPDVEPAFNYVFPSWIHWIHSAKTGFEEVTYPQDIKKCDVCHTDSGQALGTGNLVNNWKNHPTRLACGSCHNTADFTGASFVGLDGVTKTHPVQTNDSGCSVCHPGIGAPNTSITRDVVTVHDTTPTGQNVPEFDVTLTMSAPTQTPAFYSAGDAVDITATLTTHGTGTPVAGSVYTSPKDTAGNAGGGLASASLYIYGPRSHAMPLTGTQANPMFVGSANVTTDATGFRYHLVIPAGTAPGTYMLRFRAGDYGRVNDTNYKIESTAFQTFQIGTTTVQKKIDGDMCVNCHGTGTAPFHDARHSVVFNSDECVACHDWSGGHADPLANRVHAVHAASEHGDLRDSVSSALSWTEVTYPQGSMGQTTAGISTGAKICVGCHTSGNQAYHLNAAGQSDIGAACYGCHGDDPVTVDHMLQNGGPVKE